MLGFEPPTEGRARALPSEQWVDDEQVPWAWTVIQPDLLPPQWRGVPRVVGFRHEQFACGPVIAVDVSAVVDDEMLQCHVLAEVAPVGGGEPVRFHLTPWRRQVAIGHGMCGGAFRLEEGVRYSVRLVAVDLAGNETVAPGGTLFIQRPRS